MHITEAFWSPLGFKCFGLYGLIPYQFLWGGERNCGHCQRSFIIACSKTWFGTNREALLSVLPKLTKPPHHKGLSYQRTHSELVVYPHGESTKTRPDLKQHTAHWSPLWNSSARPRWLFTFFLIVLKQSDVIQADMHVITANNLSANLSHRTPKPDSGYPLDLTGFHSTLTEPSYSTTTLTDKFSIK